MAVKLKPCPFCGAPAEMKSVYTGDFFIKDNYLYRVMCTAKGTGFLSTVESCGGTTKRCFTKKEAAALWNKRQAL